MASGEYTFYPKFSEFVTLYRGVIRVWIADGTQVNPGTNGKLYAEYVDGLIQELGYVSDYETAKQYFADLGIQLTYSEWIAILANTPEYASRSKAWAVGLKINGDPVDISDETHQNNAKWYAGRSRIWTDGKNLDGTSVQPENNATFWANESHGWTNNKSGSPNSYSATNNAKYWAEQSKEYTNGKDLNNDNVPARATDNAEYFKNQAKLWANNGIQGDNPAADNNSRYWAEQSKSYSDGKNLDDSTTIRGTDNAEYYKNEAKDWVGSTNEHASATDNAIYYKNQAKLWANNGIQGDTPGADNNARYWAEQAKSYSDGKDLSDTSDLRPTDNAEYYKNEAKAWAGSTEDHASVTDNAKYWNEQSKLWSNFGTDGDSPTSSNNAKSYSQQSDESRKQSESWAVGTRDGLPDSIRQNATTDNAKYYSDNADTSAQNSEESNLQSESWAKGTRDGQPDLIRSGAATDNSKFYSEESMRWANFGTDGATPTANNNAKEYARQASESATSADTSEANAAQSATNAAASESAAAQSEANAAASESAAAQSETNAATSEHNASVSETNAANSESNAAASESAAAQSETNAAASESAAARSEANAATSESNAAQSEADALRHKTDAETAKTAAETAQSKAEEAISHNPRIKENDNWEIWDIQHEEWQDTGHKSMATANIEYSYQNSSSGTIPPTGIWSDSPQPETAKFLWMRMKYIWTNGRIDYFYNVSYIGANGTGSVNSVNGIGGDVILDGSNIYVDNSTQDKETIYQAFARIGVAITNVEIDALF